MSSIRAGTCRLTVCDCPELSPAHRPPDTRFLAALASIALIGPFAIHMFMPVLPEVQKAFAISTATAGSTFAITLAVMALTTLACGTLSDRFGRRPVLLAGLVLFSAGSALSALAASADALLAGRIVQALGAGAAASLNRAIAHDAYGPDRLVKVLAYLTMAYTVGPMLAPAIGGFLVDASGWRSTFWFAAAAGTLITLTAWTVLHETRRRSAMDPSGAQRSVSMRRAYAVILAEPRFWAFVLQSGFATAAFMSMATAASYLMQDHLGRPASEFGLYFFLFPAGLFLGNLIASRVSGRVSIETMVFAGSFLMAIGLGIQSLFILSGTLTPLVIFAPGFVMTFAQGLAYPNAQSGAMRVAPNYAGTAAGLGVCVQMLLGGAGAQIYAVLADGTPIPMVQTVMGAAVLGLACGALTYALRARR